MKPWYEELFLNYAKTYDNENFVQGTLQETGFIEAELNYNKSLQVIDVGCGTGRHSIELAKRGYKMTGIDLSENMLSHARQKANAANVKVDFFQKDARTFSFPEPFDAAIMICEGSFPLMETDEMNFSILQNIAACLKPGGKFIFTTLNGLFPLVNSVKEFSDANIVEGTSSDHHFDLMTFRDHNRFEVTDDSGEKKMMICNERYYMPSEITWQLKSLGFSLIEIFGCNVGAFSRELKLSPDQYEMMVIAIK